MDGSQRKCTALPTELSPLNHLFFIMVAFLAISWKVQKGFTLSLVHTEGAEDKKHNPILHFT